MVLNVDMAMTAIEMPMAVNHLGLPGVEISILRGNALVMYWKSFSDPSMMARLRSVTDLVLDLNSSSCLSRRRSYTPVMACFVLKTVVKLKGILTWM